MRGSIFPFRLVFLLTFLGIAFLFASIMVHKFLPPGKSNPAPTVEKKIITAKPRPTEKPIPLGYGTVIVQTEPPDAEIYINHERISSKSPAKLEKQSNQESYELLVQRPGFEPYTKIYNVEADQRMVIHVRLEKSPLTKKN